MITQVILPVAVILLAVVFLNCPIYIGILFATLYLQIFVNHIPLQNLYTAVFEALAKNSLLAVPFFILAGNLISASSLGKRLIDFFIALFRDVKGGLPITCLVSNAFFGAISGSSSAATATFSKIAYKPLEEHNGEKLALGIVTSSASLSVVIPPSIPMIMYGIAAEASITTMFKAGFLPGMLIVLIVGIFLIIWSSSKNFKASSAGESIYGDRKKTFVAALPVLILPIFILGSIYGGICTPTEVGALAAVYSLVTAVFILKDIKMKQLFDVFKDTAKITTQVFLLVAMSAAFAQATALTKLPQVIATTFDGLNQWQYLLLINVFLLIVGCFFDTSAAILIFVPLLLPAAIALDVDKIHLGIIFVVNLAIGMFTPPFGMNIFVAQSVLDKPMSRIATACIPYLILYFIAVLIITFVPQISLFLPSVLR